MGISHVSGIDSKKNILEDRDLFGSRELQEKKPYLYVISSILSQAFDPTSQFYGHRLIHDLLLGEQTQPYSLESLDRFIADVETFKIYWANSKTHYTDESNALITIFEDDFPMFCHQEYFNRLKEHRLKDRIHKPLLAVLHIRAHAWKTTTLNTTQEGLFDTFS